MRLDAIVIEPYDPGWPRSFETQATILTPVLAGVLVQPLEHIGSTSIPGMPAKPIIDMLALIEDRNVFRTVIPALEGVGWVHAPEPGDEDHRRWSLCFPTVEHRTHHLHVVEHRSTGWRDWLLFRDYVSAHPEQARRYAKVKRELADVAPTDRPRYRSGKAPLIAEIMDHARGWEQAQRA